MNFSVGGGVTPCSDMLGFSETKLMTFSGSKYLLLSFDNKNINKKKMYNVRKKNICTTVIIL